MTLKIKNFRLPKVKLLSKMGIIIAFLLLVEGFIALWAFLSLGEFSGLPFGKHFLLAFNVHFYIQGAAKKLTLLPISQ